MISSFHSYFFSPCIMVAQRNWSMHGPDRCFEGLSPPVMLKEWLCSQDSRSLPGRTVSRERERLCWNLCRNRNVFL